MKRISKFLLFGGGTILASVNTTNEGRPDRQVQQKFLAKLSGVAEKPDTASFPDGQQSPTGAE
jgi:hypothetical protein